MRYALLALTLLAASCATEFDPGERPRYPNGVNSLTLLLFDNNTGAQVTNATVRLQVGAEFLSASREGNAYTITQIPPGEFPISVQAPGYFDFVATHNFTAANNDLLTDPTKRKFTTFTVTLLSSETAVQDQEVLVFDARQGKPVQGGELTVKIVTNASGPAGATLNSLTGHHGFTTPVLTLPLSDGRATIPGTDLVFGAKYEVYVTGARDADGQLLSKSATSEFTTGTTLHALSIFLGGDSSEPVALSVNNEEWLNHDARALQNNFQVRFAQPVEICSLARDHKWTNETDDADDNYTEPQDTNYNQVWTTPAEENPVTVTLSEGGQLLTLGYVADEEDLGDSLIVYFDNIRVRNMGSSRCVGLNDVSLRDTGDEVEPVAQIRYVDDFPPIALWANNRDPDNRRNYLDINFAHRIEVCSEWEDLSWTNLTNDGPQDNPTDSNFNGIVTTPDPGYPVDYEWDSDWLEVWPEYDEVDSDDGLTVRFDGLKIRAQGSKKCVPLEEIAFLEPENDWSDTVSNVLPVRQVKATQPPLALAANNRAPNSINAQLEVTFPYPIEVCSNAGSHDWHEAGTTSGATKDIPSVEVSRASNNTKLTLKPRYSDAGDLNEDWRLTFTGVQVKRIGEYWTGGNSCQHLENVRFVDDNTQQVSTTITIRKN